MKMTDWFPPEIKPVHLGIYEIQTAHYILPQYAVWDGVSWSVPHDARTILKVTKGDLSALQDLPWRGWVEKLQESVNVPLLHFEGGTIGVQSGSEGSAGLLRFTYEDSTHPIGQCLGTLVPLEDYAIIMRFEDVKSVDVVLKGLLQVRDKMMRDMRD